MPLKCHRVLLKICEEIELSLNYIRGKLFKETLQEIPLIMNKQLKYFFMYVIYLLHNFFGKLGFWYIKLC